MNRKSYRILAENENISKKTICSLTTRVTEELIDSNELTKLLKPQNYSGTILIDGKCVPVKKVERKKTAGFMPWSKRRRGRTKKGLVVIPFIDYESHDIPVYINAYSENMYEIEKGFQMLKDLGYALKDVVCDESMGEIAQAANKVFPDVIIQFCLTHYSKCIERCFKVRCVKRSIKALENKLNRLNDSIFISTHHYARERAVEITNRIADLEYEYGYLIRIQEIFQNIFWRAETIGEINNLEDELNIIIGCMDLKNYPYKQRIADRYLDYYDKRERIIAFALHPELNIPKTTNLIEGFNSTTLELRLSSIRGFEKEENAKNYINALILKRRFTKFTDCRGKFKHLNGRSPLEIAEPLNNLYLKSRSRDWVRFCRNLYH